jgi:hypothetical protein
MTPTARPDAASRIAALPRLWVVVLLVVGALDLAVVASGPARGLGGLDPGALGPLVSQLPDRVLVEDGTLVARAAVRSGPDQAIVVDPAATTDGATTSAGRSTLVLAADGLTIVSGGERWTVPYSGSLHADELGALLTGWERAQRGPALAFAAMSGVLAAALATAVLTFGVRLAAPLGRSGVPRARDALAWWAVSLAGTSTVAATAVVATGGRAGGTLALAATCAVAAVGVCELAARRRPRAPAARSGVHGPDVHAAGSPGSSTPVPIAPAPPAPVAS